MNFSLAVVLILLSMLLSSSSLEILSRVNAQTSTCAIMDAITLATLAPTTVNTTIVSIDPISLSLKQWSAKISIGFCSSIQPTNAGLTTSADCGSSGYVTITNVTSNQCLVSYPDISSTIVYTTPTSVSFTVAANSASVNNTDFSGSKANVTVVCNSSMKHTAIALYKNASYAASTKTWDIQLQSGAACNTTTFFCTSDANCTDSGKTCKNGVCFNANCSELAAITKPYAQTNSAVLGLFAVTDCGGVPLPNLTTSDFDVLLNGVSTKNSAQFSAESDMYVKANSQSQPSLTVLLIDQSASITKNAASLAAVKDACNRFVNLVQSQNPYHYVAVVAFDGSIAPVVVVEYTTNTTTLVNGINSMPPVNLTDPSSTNLNGAVRDAVYISNAMRFSFGKLNTSVISTLIVFTDGYDTSSRVTELAAVSAVLAEVNTVRVVGIGIASTSDHIFLQSISTSGLFYFSQNISTVGTAFESIALRLSTASSATYSVGICEPLRSTSVTATFLLNSTGYTTTQKQSVTFDASKFVGGTCTNNTLASDLYLLSLNQTTSNQTNTLAVGSPLSQSVAPNTALFFTFACTTAQEPAVISVTPKTVLIYILNSSTTRCSRVSPYCYDAVISSGSGLIASCGISYAGMALPPTGTTTALSVTVTALPLSSITPAPATPTPGSPISGGTTTTTTTASSPSSSSVVFTPENLFEYFNASDYSTSGAAHVDTPAAGILVAFLLLAVFGTIIYLLWAYVRAVGPALAEDEETRRRNLSAARPSHWNNGGSSNVDRRVLDQPLVIYSSSNYPYGNNNQMSPHRMGYRAANVVGVNSNPRSINNNNSSYIQNNNEFHDNNSRTTTYLRNSQGGEQQHHGLSPEADNLAPLGNSRRHGGFVPVY